MTKQEFLDQLGQILWDLPEDERMDAVWYYEDYFADAGVENEQQVLRELGSPERVAEKIRASFEERLASEAAIDSFSKETKNGENQNNFGIDNEIKEVFGENTETKNSFTLDSSKDEKRESFGGTDTKIEDFGKSDSKMQEHNFNNAGGSNGNTGDFGSAGYGGSTGGFGGAGGYGGSEGGFGGAGGYGGGAGGSGGKGVQLRTKSYLTPAVLFLLLIFIGIPIGGPILLAFCMVMLGFFIGFGVGGVGMVAGGVVLFGNGIANISLSSGIALLLSGSGLVVAAIGIFFIIFAMNCGFRAVPAVFRWITKLFRSAFKVRRA